MDPNLCSPASRSGLQSIRDGRVQLYFELRGPADAPEKIILLNGAFATLKHFEQLAHILTTESDGRYEVLTWDYRGMGKSKVDRNRKFMDFDGKETVEPRSQTSAILAEDAMALIDAVWSKQTKVHVYGASMGGYVAQMLALNLIRQGRLLSLYLAVTTRGQPAHLAAVMGLLGAGFYKLMMPMLVKKNPEDMVKTLLPQCFDPEYLAAQADDGVQGDHVITGNGESNTRPPRTNFDVWFERWTRDYADWYGFADPEACACQCTVVGKHRLSDQQAKEIKGSKVPVFVHIALEDALMKPAEQKELAEILGAQRKEFAGGHMGKPEGYREFVDGYMQFLKGASPVASA